MRPEFIRAQSRTVRKQAALSGIVSVTIAALVLIGAASSPVIGLATTETPQPTGTTAPPPALEAFASAWTSVTAYRAKVSVFDQKGTDAQNIAFNYTFRKPSSFTVNVIEGPNAGVTLTWDGGPTVQATRGGGLFAALFKRTLSLHDPLVTTVRGASIDQLSYGAILAHAEQTPGTLAQSPGDPIAGTATQVLSLVPNDPAADAGLSHEIIEISTATQLPIRVEGYEGTTLVRRIDFSNVQPEK
jgi:outer membrane lipoprotein-sorting protein